MSACLTFSVVQAEEPVARKTTTGPALIWCLDHFPGFHHYDDTDRPVGPSVDLMQELAKRAGFELIFSARTPVARCIKMMAVGQADLMSNLKFSQQRSDIMHLLPYNTTVPESLFLRHNDLRQIKTTGQMRKLTIVSIHSYLYSPPLMTFLKQHARHVVEVDSIENGLEMVHRGRVDALLAPTVSTTEAIRNISSYQQRFRAITTDFVTDTDSYIHIGVSRKSAHINLLPEIQRHLQQMQQDGTVKRLYSDVVVETALPPPENVQ